MEQLRCGSVFLIVLAVIAAAWPASASDSSTGHICCVHGLENFKFLEGKKVVVPITATRIFRVTEIDSGRMVLESPADGRILTIPFPSVQYIESIPSKYSLHESEGVEYAVYIR